MDFLKKRDLILDVFILFISSISLLSLFSVSEFYFKQQAIFLMIGLIMYLLIPFVRLDTYTLIFPLVCISILCLLIYLAFFGASVRGSASWVDLGPFNFQPSEFTKFIIIFLCSNILSKHISSFKKLLYIALFSIPFIVFTLLQPDLGTSSVLIFIVLSLLFISLMTPKSFIFSVILVCVIGFLGYNFVLKPYQKERIYSFLNPQSDPLGSGYNVIQSKIAIGSGGIFGKGFKQNTQVSLNFLPEPHTDFIFSAGAETFGLIYSVFVVVIVFSFVYWIFYNYFLKQKQVFKMYFAFGAFSVFFVQIFLNIGMNMGLLPVTGLTLPLISYGGSSLLAFLIILGFLQLFNFE